MRLKEYRIKDIGTVIGGGTPRTDTPEYWNGDVPWLSPVDLSNYNGIYISKGAKNITELGLKKSSTRLLPKDTLLFSSRAPIGYLALAANDICTNQGFKSIVCDKTKVEPLFLYYYLKINQDKLKMFASGATFPELSGRTLKNIKIQLPKLSEQRKISSVLYNYDKLIQNYQKQIEDLQNLASELYKEWFVRFRFPGHEKASFENGIPAGWKYEYLQDIISFVRGVSYSSEEINCNDGINLINLKNIESYGGFRRDGLKKFNGKYKKEQLVCHRDLIMGITDMTQERRLVGSVALIPILREQSVISADLVKITSKISNVYFYSMCKFGPYSRYFSMFANGSNVLHLRPTMLSIKKILVPTMELVQKYDTLVEPILNKIDQLNLEIDNLAKQKALLLPRLMSGKLEVK